MRQSRVAVIFLRYTAFSLLKKGVKVLKNGNKFATNQGGVIKAPRPQKDQPKATVVKGGDLRSGTKKNK